MSNSKCKSRVYYVPHLVERRTEEYGECARARIIEIDSVINHLKDESNALKCKLARISNCNHSKLVVDTSFMYDVYTCECGLTFGD